MEDEQAVPGWNPVGATERLAVLDRVRGLSLLGVLLVNMLVGFRVSLFAHILTFHSHPDWLNRLVDVLVAGLIEFKAMALFSLLFGVGIGVQSERAAGRGVSAAWFLVRRFLVLLAIGLIHMLLIWNGDILTLYAVCGLLLIPFLKLRPTWLLILGIIVIALPFSLPGSALPPADAMRAHAVQATQIYAHGSWVEIQALRGREAWEWIRPLLIGTLPRTCGLMLLGVAAWRAGVVRAPNKHRRLLWPILVGAGSVGAAITVLHVYSRSVGQSIAVPFPLDVIDSDVLLALAYAAALFLWFSAPRTGRATAALAAAGQMALSNYVAQSVILGFIFYGYGLGFFGRLGSAVTVLLGLIIYAAQLALSRVWLQRYRFGPLEWLWRSLTYGRRQPLRRLVNPVAPIRVGGAV